MGLASKIQLLMERGINRDQALERLKQIDADNRELAALGLDPAAPGFIGATRRRPLRLFRAPSERRTAPPRLIHARVSTPPWYTSAEIARKCTGPPEGSTDGRRDSPRQAPSKRRKAVKIGQRIEPLTAQGATRIRGQARRHASELAALRAKPTPEKLEADLAAAKAELAEGKHRAAWDRAAKEAGVPDGAADDLYKLSGYKAEGEPDPAKVRAAVDAAYEPRKAYLAPRPTAARPIPRLPPAHAGRGRTAGAPATPA